MKKRLILWMMIVLMSIGTVLSGSCCNVYATVISENGTNSGMKNAVNFCVGDVIEGNLSESDSADFYKFSISKEGRMDLKYFTEIKSCYSEIYNEFGEEIWKSGNDLLNWNEVTHSLTYKTAIYLHAGTYYITISKYNDYTGNYNITTSFVDAESNIAEPNDSFSTAKTIKLNSKIKGIIDEEEETDIFKFSVPASCNLKLKMNTDSLNSDFSAYVYDMDGKQIWNDGDTFKNWNQSLTATKYLSLNKGTYYLALNQYNGHSSMYSYVLSVEKKAQKLSMLNQTKTFSWRNLKKSAKTFYIGAKAKGKITYKVILGSKYVSVSKTGKVTVKKNTSKGKYKIKVYANETFGYAAINKIVNVIVK